MFRSISTAGSTETQRAGVLIPLIRAAATIGFAVAPYSLGFVIIAVSEQLIRAIMVGDDPEMLVSELQNQFPGEAIEVNETCDPQLIATVVKLIERADASMGFRPCTRRPSETAMAPRVPTAVAPSTSV
jgi:AraC family transcriptional regulator, regulatory protein of adaptative response / methylated-DNA-[protein]-cysteine methyltransferase